MKGRLWLVVIGLGCATAILFIITLAPRDKGPGYAGRSLSEWLARYHDDPGNIWPPRPSGAALQSREAASAVTQIGTNALPSLLRWTSSEARGSVGYNVFRSVLRWLPANSLPAILAEKALKPKREVTADLAFDGFRILGPLAAPAIPQLTQLMQDTNTPETSSRCKMELACIGGAALPHLLTVLTNRDGFQRGEVVGSVWMFSSLRSLVPAVPVLADWLSDDRLSHEAEGLLVEMAHCPEIALCILTNKVCAGNRNVRLRAIQTLGDTNYIWCPPGEGWTNRVAIPSLVSLLNDPDSQVRKDSREALRRISTEAFSNAE